MTFRCFQIALALLMAVPVHLCCWMGLMKAPEQETCMACHQFLSPEEREAEPTPQPDRHCECCDGVLVRDVHPMMVAVPKPLLHEISGGKWDVFSDLGPPVWQKSFQQRLPFCEHSPPNQGVPLYHRHCTLLI